MGDSVWNAQDTKKGEQKELRIIIVGKTGNGKSSLGNTILGRKIFDVETSVSSITRQVQTAKSDRNGYLVEVIDTPDPVNSKLTPEQFEAEVKTWKQMTAPAPSAILLAVRRDVRYTAEAYSIYKKIKVQWASSVFCQRLIVVFTFADRQNTDIKEELRTVCWELKTILRDASGRYILFNNEASDTEVEVTVRRLLRMIDSMHKVSTLSTLMTFISTRQKKFWIGLVLVICFGGFVMKRFRARHLILPSTESGSSPSGKFTIHLHAVTRPFCCANSETLQHYRLTAYEQICYIVKENIARFCNVLKKQGFARMAKLCPLFNSLE